MFKQIKSVFTEEYREETAYREFMHTMLSVFKLKNKSESVEKKVERLKGEGYVSDFRIKVGKMI